MPPKRREFKRPLGERRYKKLFVIAVEGAVTEPQYFVILNNQHSVIQVKCLSGKHSSPRHILKLMKKYLKEVKLETLDEAWLVVDKDQWPDEQLDQLHAWSLEHGNYGLALSNPKFEYWLLLHFEDGNNIGSVRECSERLKRHLPDYDKGIDARKIEPSMINDAIRRASTRDKPPCTDWPRAFGTTVYRLVRKIMQA